MLTREMKNSGVEWIGEIPIDWTISKIGSHYIERNEKVSDLDYEPLSVTKGGVVPQLETAAKSSDHNNRKLVLKDDFVINSRSDRKMSAGIAYSNGSVSLINTVIYSKTMSKEYTKYLLKNYSFAEEYYRWGSGIVADLWSTRWDKMKNISIPVPEIKEQERIARKLDLIISNIDNIVDKTKLSLDNINKYKQSIITEAVTKGLDQNVKLKDSGIQSFGEIPAHWKINKVRNLFTLNKGLTITKSDLKEEGVPVISYGEIHSKYGFRFDLKKHPVMNVDKEYLETNADAIIRQGDFIFADTSEDLDGSGNFTCYVSHELCFAGYHTVILKPKNKINYNYFAYLFDSLAFRSQIQQRVQGIKVFSITQRILKPLQVVLPTQQEQEEIVYYLDKKMEIINKLIEDKSLVIEELEQYKKSLIYEFVTGKKEE